MIIIIIMSFIYFTVEFKFKKIKIIELHKKQYSQKWSSDINSILDSPAETKHRDIDNPAI